MRKAVAFSAQYPCSVHGLPDNTHGNKNDNACFSSTSCCRLILRFLVYGFGPEPAWLRNKELPLKVEVRSTSMYQSRNNDHEIVHGIHKAPCHTPLVQCCPVCCLEHHPVRTSRSLQHHHRAMGASTSDTPSQTQTREGCQS